MTTKQRTREAHATYSRRASPTSCDPGRYRGPSGVARATPMLRAADDTDRLPAAAASVTSGRQLVGRRDRGPAAGALAHQRRKPAGCPPDTPRRAPARRSVYACGLPGGPAISTASPPRLDAARPRDRPGRGVEPFDARHRQRVEPRLAVPRSPRRARVPAAVFATPSTASRKIASPPGTGAAWSPSA